MPDEQPAGTGGTPGPAQPQQPTTQPPDFETWLKGQPDEVKGLVESGTKGLKAALSSERQQRQDFERQLRDAAAKLDKGSEAQKSLEEMANKLQGLEQQADFYDQAHRLGVNDLRLAYLAAQAGGLIDAKGRVNFDGLKKAHPALFGPEVTGPGKADGGAGKALPGGSMNDFIRRNAGR